MEKQDHVVFHRFLEVANRANTLINVFVFLTLADVPKVLTIVCVSQVTHQAQQIIYVRFLKSILGLETIRIEIFQFFKRRFCKQFAHHNEFIFK